MEPLKHECGIAMIRLRKPLAYYKEKYGTYAYALNKLYLLMEKQHNRGQEEPESELSTLRRIQATNMYGANGNLERKPSRRSSTESDAPCRM